MHSQQSCYNFIVDFNGNLKNSLSFQYCWRWCNTTGIYSPWKFVLNPPPPPPPKDIKTRLPSQMEWLQWFQRRTKWKRSVRWTFSPCFGPNCCPLCVNEHIIWRTTCFRVTESGFSLLWQVKKRSNSRSWNTSPWTVLEGALVFTYYCPTQIIFPRVVVSRIPRTCY